MKDVDLYRDELEELTGKIYRGDLTPLVYDLLKDSNDIKGLLHYLNKEEVIEVKEISEVSKPESAPNFAEWFSQFPKAK